MSAQLLWKAWQGIALTLAFCSSWPKKNMLFIVFTYCKTGTLQHLIVWKRFTVFCVVQRKWDIYFEHTVASPKLRHLPLLIAVTVTAIDLRSSNRPQVKFSDDKEDYFHPCHCFEQIFSIPWVNQSKSEITIDIFFPNFVYLLRMVFRTNEGKGHGVTALLLRDEE